MKQFLLIILLAILCQALSAINPLCKTRDGSILHCVPLQECRGESAASLTRCDNYVRFCCPENIINNSLTKRIQYEIPKPYFPTYCGETLKNDQHLKKSVSKAAADDYRWLASLLYNKVDAFCAGSVISHRFVLTAANCVTGERIQINGDLTGVRLGRFYRKPKCDYGKPNCKHYQQFGIEQIIVHENYTEDNAEHNHGNDIALLRLNRNILLGNSVKPICLPFGMKQLPVNTSLTIAGWDDNGFEKRAVAVELKDPTRCIETEDLVYKGKICAAQLANGATSNSHCDGGAPLMYEFLPGRMILVGIKSHGKGICGGPFSVSYFTSVGYFLNWIETKISLFD